MSDVDAEFGKIVGWQFPDKRWQELGLHFQFEGVEAASKLGELILKIHECEKLTGEQAQLLGQLSLNGDTSTEAADNATLQHEMARAAMITSEAWQEHMTAALLEQANCDEPIDPQQAADDVDARLWPDLEEIMDGDPRLLARSNVFAGMLTTAYLLEPEVHYLDITRPVSES